MSTNKIGISAFLALSFIMSGDAQAHGGGLDSYGCHNNRKVGNYHCHRGEFEGRTFATKSAMLKALEEKHKKD